MHNPQKPVARQEGLVVQEMTDEILVFDLEANKAHCLNQTAASVWKVCDGENSVSMIARLLETESGKPVAEDLVWLAIDQLNESRLLFEPVAVDFKNQSRREVIKKIGLAAVIALPLVSSLVAPTAARAVACSGVVTNCTGCNNGTPCTGPGGGSGTCQGGACTGARVSGGIKVQPGEKNK